MLIYSPDLNTVAPSWVYFSYAFGLWLYSTFDNVDGKQARKTGTSSPLGELFDHGVDALNCTVQYLIEIGISNSNLDGRIDSMCWSSHRTQQLVIYYYRSCDYRIFLFNLGNLFYRNNVFGNNEWTN